MGALKSMTVGDADMIVGVNVAFLIGHRGIVRNAVKALTSQAAQPSASVVVGPCRSRCR